MIQTERDWAVLLCFCVRLVLEEACPAFGDILFANSGKKYTKNAAKTKVLDSFARPAPFRLLRCVPHICRFHARGIKCRIVSALAPLPLVL